MGTDKCIMGCCQLLIRLGHEVFFLCNSDKNKSFDASGFWGNHILFYKLNIFDKVYGLFRMTFDKFRKYNSIDRYYKPSITSWIKKYNNTYKFDAIIVNYISNSKYLNKISIPLKIINTHDIFAYRKERLGLKTVWYNINPTQEVKALKRANIILAIQNNEAEIFKYFCPHKEIYTVYTPFETHPGKINNNKNIIFLASNNEVNQNGIEYFLDEIFPLILKEEKDIKLIIGGTICEYLKSRSGYDIELCGRIENIDDFYNKGDIFINPIYQGTGMKMKTFEALSYGKIVVVDPHSIEGVYLQDKVPVFVGETPQKYANHILNVLCNEELRINYSNQALNYIESLNHYIEEEYKKIFH
jgi:hypothetical protein